MGLKISGADLEVKYKFEQARHGDGARPSSRLREDLRRLRRSTTTPQPVLAYYSTNVAGRTSGARSDQGRAVQPAGEDDHGYTRSVSRPRLRSPRRAEILANLASPSRSVRRRRRGDRGGESGHEAAARFAREKAAAGAAATRQLDPRREPRLVDDDVLASRPTIEARDMLRRLSGRSTASSRRHLRRCSAAAGKRSWKPRADRAPDQRGNPLVVARESPRKAAYAVQGPARGRGVRRGLLLESHGPSARNVYRLPENSRSRLGRSLSLLSIFMAYSGSPPGERDRELTSSCAPQPRRGGLQATVPGCREPRTSSSAWRRGRPGRLRQHDQELVATPAERSRSRGCTPSVVRDELSTSPTA